MTKDVFSFMVGDISALAKYLKKEFANKPDASHVEILNILARAAGFANFQHYRKQFENPAPKQIAANKTSLVKIIKYFDQNLVVKKWPNKESLRELILWFFWSRIPDGVKFNEISFSKFLNALHNFGDAALIRRYLVEYKFVSRSKDGSDYCKINLEIAPNALAIVNISKDDLPLQNKKLVPIAHA